MSDVERYWEAVGKRWGKPIPAFKDLHPQHQMQVIQSINILLHTLDEVSR